MGFRYVIKNLGMWNRIATIVINFRRRFCEHYVKVHTILSLYYSVTRQTVQWAGAVSVTASLQADVQMPATEHAQ